MMRMTLALLLGAWAACGPGPASRPGRLPAPAPRPPAVDPAYASAIEAWRAERAARLRAPEGWLRLAGRHWIAEGQSRMGSEPASEIVLPAGAPRRVGTITLAGGRVSFRAEAGVGAVTGDGQPVDEVTLQTDGEGKTEPTRIRVGRLAFHVIERGGRLALRLFDEQAAGVRQFHGLRYFALDPRWRISARFVPYSSPREVEMSTVIQTTVKAQVPGEVRFEVEGRNLTLYPVAEPGEAQLFFVFADKTNGHETYGGGRFLYADRPARGRVLLDFNKAVNPPCAFTEFATCPVPRAENRLPVRVTAGEMAYGEH